MRKWLSLTIASFVMAWALSAQAQSGPYSAQIQRALATFLANAQTFTSAVAAPSFQTTTALVSLAGGSGTPAFVANSSGGSGQPTTAAQNSWLKATDSTGATIWIPVWK